MMIGRSTLIGLKRIRNVLLLNQWKATDARASIRAMKIGVNAAPLTNVAIIGVSGPWRAQNASASHKVSELLYKARI
jgi:hypothetical protein